jgi:hypothetical protein
MKCFAWTRLFRSWTEVFECLVFVAICVAGFLYASWMWNVIGTMTLFLLDWPRSGELFSQAASIDAECFQRGKLAWKQGGYVDRRQLFEGAFHLPLVLGGKAGYSVLYLTAIFFLRARDGLGVGAEVSRGDTFAPSRGSQTRREWDRVY